MSLNEEKIDVREGIVHSSIPQEELARLSDDVIGALKTVYDPEIPADSSASSTRSISKTTGW